MDTFSAYKQQIGNLLNMADQLLQPAERDTLRLAMREHRTTGTEVSQFRIGLLPRAQNIGERLALQLRSADTDLTREQVAELEALIHERLDVGI